ncbi:hypothetical protein F8M49_03005 [Rhodococcus zopfii]|uniref:Enhanced intracellular survival protein domain-containing protein n=1 Tax=Rhodococcus zopfii TaxID=43772 RepID=A0ABU3WL23_9NOCA|nr:hypothetical protein [Rhodococcus zopfii]
MPEIGGVGAAPQVEVDVATLAAVLLGGTRWHQLDRAGLVRMHDEAALPQLERLFATAEAPFAGVMFQRCPSRGGRSAPLVAMATRRASRATRRRGPDGSGRVRPRP